MDSRFLSRFTPSLMTPEALEAIFVQREELLRNILESIGISALTRDKRNLLLIGPRGIGKTHLISMIYYRLQAVEELRDHILVGWLREEEWGISCFRDLLFRILRALPLTDGETRAMEKRLDSIYSLEIHEVEAAASALIRELAGRRTLVILAENLDELIRKLGNTEEAKLYRFLRESGLCCMVATSPGPAARLFPQGSPFNQGFFRVQQLSELTVEDAIHLIFKIAAYQGDKELISLIATPRGRARVRALRYLAGGNHRAYVIFAPLLAIESIEKLVKPLMETVDDLTPYYSSRIAALPLEQRKIIEYVCEGRHPVRMADIARSCFLPPATASAQLEILCRLGHLQSFRIGDMRYYELREPLMRLSIEVKKHRGKPIGLLLDFLRLWYSPAELKQKLALLPSRAGPEQIDAPSLQALRQSWEDPRTAECCREYNASVGANDFEKALRAAEELAAMRGSKQDLSAQAFCLSRLGRLEEAAAVYGRIVSLNPDDAEGWHLRARVLHQAGRYEEALASCGKSLELAPDSGKIWCLQASILLNLARFNEALRSCDTAIKLNDADAEAWTARGTALADHSLFKEAAEAFSKAVQLAPRSAHARINSCAALIELNRFEQALEQAQAAIEIDPQEPSAWVLKGSALNGAKRYGDSLQSFQKAVALGEDSPFVQFKIAELLIMLERWREGTARLDETLGKFAHSENPSAGNCRALIRNLLPSLSAPKILHLSIKVLLLIYQKHALLGALGQGLIECIPDVVSSAELSDADAAQWLGSWQTMAESFPEFRLPLRLLESAVRYRKTRDLESLMSLPQEERKLLEPLVGVHVEAIA